MKSSNFLSIAVFVGFFLLISCDDQDQVPDLRDRATITGQDFRLCACCGGWFIDIDNEQYRITVAPITPDIGLFDGEFPIEVFIDWKSQEDACLGDEIDVISIELVP